MIVAGDEGDGRTSHPPTGPRAQHRRDQPAQQQRGRGGVAVVNFVAHVERLRDQWLELGMPPVSAKAASSAGYSVVAIHSKRSRTVATVGTETQTFPSPSLRLLNVC